jgi:uncharacterized protein YidB (DUF937 family)
MARAKQASISVADAPCQSRQIKSPTRSVLDTIDHLSKQFNMPRDQMLSELSTQVPSALDHATPQGRIPKDDDLEQRWR